MHARSFRRAVATRGVAVAALALALVCAVVAPASFAAPAPDISVETLANGMRVVLWPDHSIPNLAMFTFYRVGSRNEHTGTTGLSHFFEHMMFNGSKNYGPGEFDRTMEASGGANNAYTAQDITVYQNWFPRTALETIFQLEADRIASLAIDSAMVESERGVVTSERRRSVEDHNMNLLDEQHWAAAYIAHPYQWPVIGWMVDIENWKIADLRAYFRTYYAPNNATFVLTGDFQRDEVRNLLHKYLEPIPSGPKPPPVTTAEPAQKGERRGELRKPAELAAIIAGWHVPAASHSDYYALRVLEALLFRGESSRLVRRLVEREQVALTVGGGMQYALDPTLFQVNVQVKEGIETARVESLLYDELGRLQSEAPPERELQKAKNQLAADLYRNLQTISGKAQLLGIGDVYFGDPKALLNVADRYAGVTAADLQRVARTYFIASNRTVSVLVPEAAEENKAAASTPSAGGL